MKRFFNDDDTWSREAVNLASEAVDVLRPVFQKYIDAGYSAREISHIVMIEVGTLEAMLFLGYKS